MKRNYIFLLIVFLFSATMNTMGQTPFIVAKTSDPGVTTHEITSGNVTLGITDKGGGMINKFTLPGYGDIMGNVADRYGRGGQTAVRSLGHSHKYNPTQAGLTDASGTQCNITATTGKLVVDKRPCCLWRADNAYDFIEWEDLCNDNYNDGGTSGHNSDVDGIDETNLPGKQAEEVTSEFDFYCEYQDYMDSSGVDIPCFYHYYEMEYTRYPGHCIDQFGEGTSVWSANQIVGDISVNAPSGTHQGTDQDMNTFTHWTTLRTDNNLWAGNYRHLVQVTGAWHTEARTAKAQSVIHIAGAEVFPLLIISNSTDINAGPAIGVFQPNSDIVAQQTVGGTYTDDRRKPKSAWVQDDPDRAGQNKFGFGGRTWGLLNRNRTPNNDPEMWRGEMYFLVGTPAEIYSNALKLNAEWATGNLPSAPTGLSLSTGETSCDYWVASSWTANAASDKVTVYEVWRSTAADGTYDFVASTTGTSYTDGGLDPSDEYFYKIKAASQAGTSAYSSYQSITTQADCGPDEYTLTVNSGTGDGDYAEGTVVNIVADTPPSADYVFDQWTGDVANVADLNAASTTFTMTAIEANITATYKAITYELTVTSGTGGGIYPESTVVDITANAPPSADYAFDQWTGDVANVADVNDDTTTITMPATNATLTATYVDTTSSTTAIESKGSNKMQDDMDLKIYPNPANKILFIEIPENFDSDRVGEVTLSWMDARGKSLGIESNLVTGVNTISMEGLSMGLYFIQISSQEGTKLFKIIKH